MAPEPSDDRLVALLYEELRALAGAQYRGRANVAAQPTSLVHEAWLKLRGAEWNDREHFLAIASTAMRQILADRARRQRADKRGGGWERVTLAGVRATGAEDVVDVIALDDALARLEALDPRQARIVVLRIFAGLQVPEIAVALGVSESTVEKEWRRARAWLAATLSAAPG